MACVRCERTFDGIAQNHTLQTAIKALTENAALILGLDKKLGKLEAGFDADVVVWNGHPLDTRSKPLYVFIDGEKALERS